MSKKDFHKKAKEKYDLEFGDMDFDVEAGATDESPELLIYKQMLEEATAKVMLYERFLLDRGLMSEANAQYVPDEEIICKQGIESIKRLVIQGTFTKDDISVFDTLYKNLLILRGIEVDMKKVKKSIKETKSEDLRNLIKIK